MGSEFNLGHYTAAHDVVQRLISKFEFVGSKESWITQLSTFARSDIYSEDPFSRMRDEVLGKVADGAGINSVIPALSCPEQADSERFPSLAVQ